MGFISTTGTKTQLIRLVDVIIIGPLMIYLGYIGYLQTNQFIYLILLFFGGTMHIVNKVMKKNSIIEIKAHTPVAAILPISISQFENATLNNYLIEELEDHSKIFYPHNTEEYSLALKKYGEDNHRTANWYAKGIDHNHNIIGNHEINNFNFNIKKGTNV